MITTINKFKNNKKITHYESIDSINENNIITFDSIIDMKRLQKFAEALHLMCNGEYGNTYYNKKELKLAIVLGDSNPFDIKALNDWIINTVVKKYDNIDKLNIEIDMEWVPGNVDWSYWNGKKWISN
jgi:hypothetical protein